MSQDANILISGASRGLGAETAVAAAQLGAKLILTARNLEGLEETAKRIAAVQETTQVKLVAGDLSDAKFCQHLAAEVRTQGPLGALVHNAAMIEPIGRIQDLDEEQWLRCLQVNLSSPFLLSKHLLPQLVPQGRLITVGTGAATQPIASWSAYCTSKAALLMLTRVVAAEYPEVTALSFVPGVVNTGMQQNIRDRKDKMPDELGSYFSGLHESGQLEPPEVPARALAWCALHAPPDWTGQEVVYSHPSLVEAVNRAFR